jgi:uncharacterized protein (TIGR03435 family)
MYENKKPTLISRGKRAGSFLALAAVAAGASFAQSKPSPLFEAASVKLAAPMDFGNFGAGGRRPGVKVNAGRIEITMTPLSEVITGAFRLKDYQLSGPDWMKSIVLDIQAKLPEGASEGQIPEMLQALLAERFGLRFHRETKDHPVFALVVGKGGPKLKEAVEDPEHPAVPVDPKAPDFGMISRMSNATMSGDPMKGMTISGLPGGGTMRMTFAGAGLHIESSSVTMAGLAEDLGQYLDRPVVDRTNLKGRYQVGLDVSMDDMRNFMSKQGFPGGPPPGDAGGGRGGPNPFAGGGEAESGSSVLESVQRLGLKLDTQKAPVEVIVIDHLERTPTEN